MPMAEAPFHEQIVWLGAEGPRQPAPPPPAAEDMPEEPWLPARDVTLMTLAAFLVITFASLFH